MNITWHGQTCFKVITQKDKNGQINILIDPFEKEVGIRPPKTEADILLSTEGKKISGSAFLISGPGEYDLKGVSIHGISSQGRTADKKNNTIYLFETEGMRICHLGFLEQKELNAEQIEAIGDVDILMVPVGGEEALEPEEAVKIVSQVEPRITIPMYYQIPGLKEKLGGVDKFLKLLGVKSLAPVPKLSIKKKDLSEDEAKIVVLTP